MRLRHAPVSAWTVPVREQLLDGLDDLLDDLLGVADDRHVGAADLALLGRVDVDVDDLGLGGERRHLAGDAVVEAAPMLMSRSLFCIDGDRRGVAVHAGHAEAQLVVVGERAAGHQRGDDVDVGSSASSRSASAARAFRMPPPA
jgi:hypothetical protein